MAGIGIPVQKIKKNSGSMMSNYWDEATREKETLDPDIDKNKTKDNIWRMGSAEMDFPAIAKAYANSQRDAKGRSIRSDAVICMNAIIKPEAAYIESLPKEERIRLLDVAVEEFKELQGKERFKEGCCAIVYHLDEQGSHAHIFWLPIVYDKKLEREKLSAKECCNKKWLNQVNQKLPGKVREAGFDIKDADCWDTEMTAEEKTALQQRRKNKRNGRSSARYKADKEREIEHLEQQVEQIEERLADSREMLEQLRRENEQKELQLQAAKLLTESAQNTLERAREELKDKQKELCDKQLELDKTRHDLYAAEKLLAEKESLLRSRDSELQIQKRELVAVSNELQDMAQYQAKAKGCWDKLEEIRNLLLNQYGSKWPLRNRKAERNLLDAIERGRDYIMAAVAAMIAFEVRSNMPQEHRASEAINKGLQKSLDLMVSDAKVRSEASESMHFDRKQDKKYDEIEI